MTDDATSGQSRPPGPAPTPPPPGSTSPPPPPPGSASPPPPESVSPPPPPPGLTPPPGYVGYDNQPTPQGTVRRVGGLAKAGTILVPIVAAVTVLQTVLSAGVVDDAEAYLAGDTTDDEFQDAIVALSSVGLLASLATLAAGIVTIIWMYRIATNVRTFGRRTTWNPLFTIFGWFLPPLVLYVIPFLVLRELWKASDADAGDDDWRSTGDTVLLWIWFAVFGLLPSVLFVLEIGSVATSGIGGGALESQAEALDDFGAVQTLAAILSVLAAATWVPFVRRLTDRHTALTGER